MIDLLGGVFFVLFAALVTGAGFLMGFSSTSLSMLLLELTDSLDALLALVCCCFFFGGGGFFLAAAFLAAAAAANLAAPELFDF